MDIKQDVNSGEILWKYPESSTLSFINEDKLFFIQFATGGYKRGLKCVSFDEEYMYWEIEGLGNENSNLIPEAIVGIVDDLLIIHDENGTIFYLAQETGDIVDKWNAELIVGNGVHLYEDELIVLAGKKKYTYQLLTKMVVISEIEIEGSLSISKSIIEANNLFFKASGGDFGLYSNHIGCYNLDKNDVSWCSEIATQNNDYILSLKIINGVFYALSNQGMLYRYEQKNGIQEALKSFF